MVFDNQLIDTFIGRACAELPRWHWEVTNEPAIFQVHVHYRGKLVTALGYAAISDDIVKALDDLKRIVANTLEAK
jgi:hypothetical protein